MSCVRLAYADLYTRMWVQVFSKEMISGGFSRRDRVKSGKEKKLTSCALLSRATEAYSHWGPLAYPVEYVSKIFYPKVRKPWVFIQILKPSLAEHCFGGIHLFQIFNWTLLKDAGSRWEFYIPQKAKMGYMNLPSSELALNEHSHTGNFNLYLGIW